MTEGIASPLYIRWKGSLFPLYALRLALAYWDQAPSQSGGGGKKQLRLRGEAIPLWKGKMLVSSSRRDSLNSNALFSDVLEGQTRPF